MMMKKGSIMMLCLVVCMSMSMLAATQGLARTDTLSPWGRKAMQMDASAAEAEAPDLLSSSSSNPGKECRWAIRDTRACVAEIIESYRTRHLAIGADCCKAILQAEEDCIVKFFPSFQLHFPPLLKHHCSHLLSPSPSPSPSLSPKAFPPQAPTPTPDEAPAPAPQGGDNKAPAPAPQGNEAPAPAPAAPEEDAASDIFFE